MTDLDALHNLFNKVDSLIVGMKIPGFSVGVLNRSGAEPQFFNWGTWSGENSPTVTENTIYDLASISKLYTAGLVLLLHQDGRLNIDDRCSQYLDVFNGSDLTIHDLLTHKAHFNTGFSVLRENYPDRIAEAIFSIKPPQTASSNRNYQNATYTYLGRIAEVVTSQSLTENFEKMFCHLDLANTYPGTVGQQRFISPPTEKMPDGSLVQSVTHDETARMMGGVAGHAGLFASSQDLLRFGVSWLNGRLIRDKNLYDRVFRNYSANTEFAQGLGWQNRPSYLSEYYPDIFHQPGFTGGTLAMHRKTGAVICLLCNRSFAGRDNADHKMLRRLIFEFLATA